MPSPRKEEDESEDTYPPRDLHRLAPVAWTPREARKCEEEWETEITTIGIDLAKSVFAVSCADGRGKVVKRKQLRREQVLEFLRGLKPCVVGMEACGGAHHWGRAGGALGHEVRLMNPALVRPYRKGPNKHDRSDADAICEAVGRPQMRYVEVKRVAQQDAPALHRMRTQLMKERIALSNLMRSLLHRKSRGGQNEGKEGDSKKTAPGQTAQLNYQQSLTNGCEG